MSCKAISTAAFPNITPVDPPIVNINKNKREKYEEVTKEWSAGVMAHANKIQMIKTP